jgi:hypothetical protein
VADALLHIGRTSLDSGAWVAECGQSMPLGASSGMYPGDCYGPHAVPATCNACCDAYALRWRQQAASVNSRFAGAPAIAAPSKLVRGRGGNCLALCLTSLPLGLWALGAL